MIKIIVIGVILNSFSAFAADAQEPVIEVERVQAEIRSAGYECERVDHVENRWFFGTQANVVCDKVFRFVLRYEQGGVSVEVVSL